MHPAAGKKSPPNVEDNFSFEQIQQVIQRAKQLAERLRTNNNAQHLDRLRQELQKLSSQMLDSESNDNWSADDRQRIYLQARWLARRIAFTNPLLDFDKLLFIKRHDAAGVFHMCDQYYGCNAVPGGGLYVLSDPFGPESRADQPAARPVVASGRLDGPAA